MGAVTKLKHADGTLVTAQEAYDAFMTTRVLIRIGNGVATATGIEWYDNNSAQSDPTNVGYVIMYYYTPNVSSVTSVSIGDASLKPA